MPDVQCEVRGCPEAPDRAIIPGDAPRSLCARHGETAALLYRDIPDPDRVLELVQELADVLEPAPRPTPEWSREEHNKRLGITDETKPRLRVETTRNDDGTLRVVLDIDPSAPDDAPTDAEYR